MENRHKIQECKKGNVVVEIYRKDEMDGKIFFDFKLVREYRTAEDEFRRGVMIQNRDSLDAITAIIEANKHVNGILKVMRNNSELDDNF